MLDWKAQEYCFCCCSYSGIENDLICHTCLYTHLWQTYIVSFFLFLLYWICIRFSFADHFSDPSEQCGSTAQVLRLGRELYLWRRAYPPRPGWSVVSGGCSHPRSAQRRRTKASRRRTGRGPETCFSGYLTGRCPLASLQLQAKELIT